MSESPYKLIVFGASYGGISALKYLLPKVSSVTDLPMVVVQHISASHGLSFSTFVDNCVNHTAKEAECNEEIKRKFIYLAPGGYHLLIEKNFEMSLSVDMPVRFSRPSIDVLFESAAEAYGSSVIAILLTGANNDGADGIAGIKDEGGVTIVQDPHEATSPIMPASAIKTKKVDYVLTLEMIPQILSMILQGGDIQ